ALDTARGMYPCEQLARKLSGLLWPAVADPVACGLGRKSHLWFRPSPIRTWGARSAGERTRHLRHSSLPQRRDLLHPGLRGYNADLSCGARACGYGIWSRLQFPGTGGWLSTGDLFVVFVA